MSRWDEWELRPLSEWADEREAAGIQDETSELLVDALYEAMLALGDELEQPEGEVA